MSFAHSPMARFPNDWDVLPFDDAIEDATGGNAKIQTRDYLPVGQLRVIDQGQSEVAGYVDDTSLACKSSLPCILFGDHTRNFKFAETPFALGADGVKVLVPRKGLDARFVFQYLRTIRLPVDLGYSRHFKYLREAIVPRPPMSEQRRIADILDKADAIRRKRKQAIALTDQLLRSTFLEMFGDPVTNPKGWPVRRLSEFGGIVTGNTPSREISEYYGTDIEWIKSDNINTEAHFLTKATEGLSVRGLTQARTVPAGSILITCIAGSPSCIGNAAIADREVSFNQQINAIIPSLDTDFRFLYGLILLGKRHIQSASTNSMKGMVSKGRLGSLVFPYPPIGLQLDFGKAFDRIISFFSKARLFDSLGDSLFHGLVDRAFRGELSRTEQVAEQLSMFNK